MEVDNEQPSAASMEAWELSKENYVPVKTGRTKAVLEELSNPADTTTKLALEKTRRALEQEIEEYSGDDPLEPWLKLVKWAQEHLPGGKTELQKLLRVCTTKLVNNPRYKNDKRFLRIWIQYADCLPDPSDIFLFLKEKGIGLEHALYYEAYATYLELRGNCQAAEAVYMDGINKLAHPTERLKQKHAAFQSRMAQRAQRRIQEAASTGVGPTPTSSAPPRASLAPLVPVAPRSSLLASSSTGDAGRSLLGGARNTPAAPAPAVLGVARPPTAPGLLGGRSQAGSSAPRGSSLLLPQQAQQQQGQSSAGGGPQPSRLLGGLLAGTSNNSKATQLAIPTDEEFQGSGPKQLLPGYATMPQGVNNLKSLKPYSIMRKENQETPSTWVGHTLPQANAGPYAPTAPPARLEICVDEEFEDEDDPLLNSTTSHSNASTSQTLSSVLPAKPQIPAVLASNPAGGLGSGRAAALPTARPTAAEIMAGLHNKQFPQQPQPSRPVMSGLLGSKLQPVVQASQPDSSRHTGQQQAVEPAMKQSVLAGTASLQARNTGTSLAGFAQQPTLSKPASTPAAGPSHRQTVEGNMNTSLPHMPAVQAPSVAPLHHQQQQQQQQQYGVQSNDSDHSLSLEEIRGKVWLMQHPQPENVLEEPWYPLNNANCAVTQPSTQSSLQLDNAAVLSSVHGRTEVGIAAHKAEVKQPRQAAGPRKAFATITADVDSLSTQATEPSKVAVKETIKSTFQQQGSSPSAHQPNFASEDSYIAPNLDIHVKMPCQEPTVTVATKQAFDALNDMFGGCDSGYGKPRIDGQCKAHAAQAKIVGSSTSFPEASQSAISVSQQPQTVHDDTQTAVSTHTFAEPTVTINTRAAFDALNDMWGSDLPHEGERRSSRQRPQSLVAGGDSDLAKMPSLPATMKPISAVDVCRLANSSKGLTAGNRTRSLVEPSIPAQHNTSAASCQQPTTSTSSNFAIHEDTELITHLQDSGNHVIHQTHSPFLSQAMQYNPGSAPHQAMQSSIQVYEDTVVTGLSELVAQASQGSDPIQQQHHDMQPEGGGGGMMLYEDTEFISAPPVANNISNVRPPAAGMGAGAGSFKQPLPSATTAAGKENSIFHRRMHS